MEKEENNSKEEKKSDITLLHVMVTPKFLEYFDKLVAKAGYKRNEAIREAIRRFIVKGEKRYRRMKSLNV